MIRKSSTVFAILVVALIVVIILSGVGIGIYLGFQYKDLEENIVIPEKKAFIIIPGIMGSSLIDPEYDNAVVFSTSPQWILEKLMDTENPDFIKNYLSELFVFDNNGIPQKTLIPADMNTTQKGYSDDKYAFGGITKNYTNYLTEQYADDGYEVITWQYDWREANSVTAQKLEKFVNDNKYTNIIFLAHSMGGNVVSDYIVNPDNRSKVDLFISFGTPYFGALDGMTFLLESEAEESAFLNNAVGAILTSLGIDEKVQDMPSIIDLLPYEAWFGISLYNDFDSQSPITIDNEKTTYQKFYELLRTESFAFGSDGRLKPMMSSLEASQRNNFVYDKATESYTHITNYINTVYVVGTGHQTTYSMNITGDKITSTSKDNMGDSLVWAYSASAGHALTDENVIVINGEDFAYGGHNDLINNPNVIELTKPIIEKYVKHTAK